VHELQYRNLSRNILFFKSLNALKMSRNWGSKFKRPHRYAMCYETVLANKIAGVLLQQLKIYIVDFWIMTL
jgi:hypothetical protein